MNFYAYCLSDEVMERMVESAVGLTGAGAPRVIWYDGIGAVVSLYDADAVAVTRENVFAHERVIRHVLAHTTPLPFRFGTVVSAAGLESYVNSQRDFLEAQLARVRGCVEMSVKIIWNAEAVKDEAVERDAKESGAVNESGAGRGAAFLAAKRQEILGDEALKAQAERVAAWLAERLKGAVREWEVSVHPTAALVVAAAHLVERERLEDYRERIQNAQAERPELHFLTSGPWPPYSFSSARS
jgi:hypothetical protein